MPDKYRAVFLDRDGVINRAKVNDGKPFSPRCFEDFELLPMVAESIASLKEKGFKVIVATNQPDIARGLLQKEELDKMHALVTDSFSIDRIMVCAHDDADDCDCRKPKPGMLVTAAEEEGIDLSASFMVGDTWKDMKAGKSAGCKTILIDAPYNNGIECDYKISEISGVPAIVSGNLTGHLP